jgi:hypothetical protein
MAGGGALCVLGAVLCARARRREIRGRTGAAQRHGRNLIALPVVQLAPSVHLEWRLHRVGIAA